MPSILHQARIEHDGYRSRNRALDYANDQATPESLAVLAIDEVDEFVESLDATGTPSKDSAGELGDVVNFEMSLLRSLDLDLSMVTHADLDGIARKSSVYETWQNLIHIVATEGFKQEQAAERMVRLTASVIKHLPPELSAVFAQTMGEVATKVDNNYLAGLDFNFDSLNHDERLELFAVLRKVARAARKHLGRDLTQADLPIMALILEQDRWRTLSTITEHVPSIVAGMLADSRPRNLEPEIIQLPKM